MPITRQEAGRLLEARKAAREAIDARLDAMMISLFQSLQVGSGGGLIHEIVSFAREIDRSMLCRSAEADAKYKHTIWAEIPGEISRGAEDMLCRIYEDAGWFIHFYNKYDSHNTSKKYVLVRGFDIAEKAQYLAE